MKNELTIIAQKMKRLRLSQNLRIQDVVELTGLNKETIRKLESGEDFKVTTWLCVLEVLDPMAIQNWLHNGAGECSRTMDLFERIDLRNKLSKLRVRVKNKGTK